jgi:hypothetical protein
MASNGSNRGGLLTASGILSIIVGAFEMTFGAVVAALTMSGIIPCVFHCGRFEIHITSSFTYLGVPLLVLGIIAIAGGVSALRRRSFGLSLAGAICALPSGLMGILAIIFVSPGKREFGVERKGNASNGNNIGGLLTAGGILSIVEGLFDVTGGAIMVGLVIAHRELFRLAPPGTYPGIRSSLFGYVDLIWLLNVGVPLIVLGIIAIVGGVSAIRRKSFALSLAGAICALPAVVFSLYLAGAISALASVILGILAVIFIALSRKEFGVGS